VEEIPRPANVATEDAYPEYGPVLAVEQGHSALAIMPAAAITLTAARPNGAIGRGIGAKIGAADIAVLLVDDRQLDIAAEYRQIKADGDVITAALQRHLGDIRFHGWERRCVALVVIKSE
jgi:hypothetical protein